MMPLILGLAGGKVLPDGTIVAGSAGVGKDTVADYLVEQYGFTKFAFSDRLYAEVCEAFDLEDEELLRNRETKEVPSQLLALENCSDVGFIEALVTAGMLPDGGDIPLSPRAILQWWGTEYRRAQNPDYWVEETAQWLLAQQDVGYPEHRAQAYVNTTVRFENEREWIKSCNGNVWHLRRPVVTAPATHVSEWLLPVKPGERELWNCDTLQRLFGGIDLLMRTSARFVHVLPMEKPDAQ